jgi:hypothetical protein
VLLAGALASGASGCRRRAVLSAPPDTSAFERIPAVYRIGTSSICSRGAFLPENDERVFDGGDFIGRAIAVFGAPDPGHEFVLRHKPTGIVITLYTGSAGPAFGGGPVYPGELPPPDDKALLRAAFDRGGPHARLSDAGPMLDVQDELMKGHLQKAERMMCERADPAGFARLAETLEQALDATPPADWETVEDTDDGPYRIGARGGKSFAEKVRGR